MFAMLSGFITGSNLGGNALLMGIQKKPWRVYWRPATAFSNSKCRVWLCCVCFNAYHYSYQNHC